MTVLRNSSSVALEEPPLSNPSWLIAGPGITELKTIH